MKPYFIKDCSGASIEMRALINFRLGYTCFGFAYTNYWILHRPVSQHPFLVKILPRFSFTLFANTDQCMQKIIFHFTAWKLGIGYKTAGERKSAIILGL